MEIIRKILQLEHFFEQPPVLIDIGASGGIHKKWKTIAPYSVCIAFDADDREFSMSETSDSQFKKLIRFNRIVTADHNTQPQFYLTSSPYCSSLLKPDYEKLKPWVFQELFKVDKVATLPAVTLPEVLGMCNINYIDWFKTDTQGTDLRLYRSLPQTISKTILVAEFEPGILDAYEGEDKLYKVMEQMHCDKFWLSSMEVKGTQRLGAKYIFDIGISAVKRIIRKSPGWAEVTYLQQPSLKNERELLLLIVFALLEKQFGFALEVADHASEQFELSIFIDCKKAILNKLSSERWKVPLVIMKRQFKKLFSAIND